MIPVARTSYVSRAATCYLVDVDIRQSSPLLHRTPERDSIIREASEYLNLASTTVDHSQQCDAT